MSQPPEWLPTSSTGPAGMFSAPHIGAEPDVGQRTQPGSVRADVLGVTKLKRIDGRMVPRVDRP